jgi:AcrR family transcriptional regulator
MSEDAISVRAARKDERRARISTAARAIFHARGFHAATTAEIAKRARVGVATLFRYAADKNELLLMVLNDELARITDESIANIDPDESVVSQLVAFYRGRFAYWSSDVELAKAATAYVYMAAADKPERIRAQARERQQLAAIAGILQSHTLRAGATLRHDPDVAAQIIQYVYRGELRRWLHQPNPRLAEAMERLGEQFSVIVDGLYACQIRKNGL